MSRYSDVKEFSIAIERINAIRARITQVENDYKALIELWDLYEPQLPKFRTFIETTRTLEQQFKQTSDQAAAIETDARQRKIFLDKEDFVPVDSNVDSQVEEYYKNLETHPPD